MYAVLTTASRIVLTNVRHCLRRAALRAIAAPKLVSTSLNTCTRTFATQRLTTTDFLASTPTTRLAWTQRRFASDVAPEQEQAPSEQEARATEVTEETESSGSLIDSFVDSAKGVVGSVVTGDKPTDDDRRLSEDQLYVGNLHYRATEEAVTRHFQHAAPVKSVVMPKKEDGNYKGFAFVKFESPEAAATALEQLSSVFFLGRALTLRYAITRPPKDPRRFIRQPSEEQPSRTLYVSNLPWEAEDAELQEFFGPPIKHMLDVRIGVDRQTGQLKGNAHVEFTNLDGAAAAMEIINGKMFKGRAVRCQYARPKSQRPREAVSEPASQD